jgi:hypothetical protein
MNVSSPVGQPLTAESSSIGDFFHQRGYGAAAPMAWMRRHRHQAGIAAFAAVAALAGPVVQNLGRWPWRSGTPPNCAAARAVGLVPAYWGQPGYCTKHDPDKHGIACEPWPRR